MNLAVLGSGGREHAICYKLKQSSKIKKLFCIPGNAGTQKIAKKNTEVFEQKTNNLFNDKFKGFEYNIGEKKFRFNVKDVGGTKKLKVILMALCQSLSIKTYH